MKKLIALLLAALMLLSVCACGSSEPEAPRDPYDELIGKWEWNVTNDTWVAHEFRSGGTCIVTSYGSSDKDIFTAKIEDGLLKIGYPDLDMWMEYEYRISNDTLYLWLLDESGHRKNSEMPFQRAN